MEGFVAVLGDMGGVNGHNGVVMEELVTSPLRRRINRDSTNTKIDAGISPAEAKLGLRGK